MDMHVRDHEICEPTDDTGREEIDGDGSREGVRVESDLIEDCLLF